MLEEILNFTLNFIYKSYLILKYILTKLWTATKWILLTAVKEFIKQFFKFIFSLFFKILKLK